VIGGNVWLTHSVPATSNVHQPRAENEISARLDDTPSHQLSGRSEAERRERVQS
jgi:hypothetical protein